MVKLVYLVFITTFLTSTGFAKNHKPAAKIVRKTTTQKAPDIDTAEVKVLLQETSTESFLSWIKTVDSDFEQKHVFFFDTQNLDLEKQGVILRVRRMHDETYDSTVKLRSSDAFTELPNVSHKNGKLDCELDVILGGPKQTSCGLTQKSKKVLPSVDANSASSYFNSAQTAFAKYKFPDIKWKDLKVLGGIIATEWETQQEGMGITCELWTLPSKKRLLECSTRTPIKEAEATREKLASFLKSKNFSILESSQYKIDIALSELK